MKFVVIALLLVLGSCSPTPNQKKTIILISANAEWRVIKSLYPNEKFEPTPWGEYFETDIPTKNGNVRVTFFHEGWGKVAAAGATQYAIDQWNPEVMNNLGTCGGFEGSAHRFDILLINKTVIYDIKGAMGDSKEAIQDYSSEIDMSWISIPDTIQKTLLVSADRDLVPEEMAVLKQNYGAIAGDWETGAIAYVCKRNNKKLMVLRGVSDLVSPAGGEAYGNAQVFVSGTEVVMKKLIQTYLPAVLSGI